MVSTKEKLEVAKLMLENEKNGLKEEELIKQLYETGYTNENIVEIMEKFHELKESKKQKTMELQKISENTKEEKFEKENKKFVVMTLKKIKSFPIQTKINAHNSDEMIVPKYSFNLKKLFEEKFEKAPEKPIKNSTALKEELNKLLKKPIEISKIEDRTKSINQNNVLEELEKTDKKIEELKNSIQRIENFIFPSSQMHSETLYEKGFEFAKIENSNSESLISNMLKKFNVPEQVIESKIEKELVNEDNNISNNKFKSVKNRMERLKARLGIL